MTSSLIRFALKTLLLLAAETPASAPNREKYGSQVRFSVANFSFRHVSIYVGVLRGDFRYPPNILQHIACRYHRLLLYTFYRRQDGQMLLLAVKSQFLCESRGHGNPLGYRTFHFVDHYIAI